MIKESLVHKDKLEHKEPMVKKANSVIKVNLVLKVKLEHKEPMVKRAK